MERREEKTRKGQWTEQEDKILVSFVGVFGDRRWDSIARVSGLMVAATVAGTYKLDLTSMLAFWSWFIGLNRTGKSCRLRWVNYLQPGLKHSRMSPKEEHLVLELHARWGNKWSLIAKRLPGRTDNEIKNFWRTYTRKKAQAAKKINPSSSSSFTASVGMPKPEEIIKNESIGGPVLVKEAREALMDECHKKCIWDDAIKGKMYKDHKEETCRNSCSPMLSPPWSYYSDVLWNIQDEEEELDYPLSWL